MKDRIARVCAEIEASLHTKRLLLEREAGTIAAIAGDAVRCLSRGGRVFLAGNGGSAADAQHIAAELEGRYRRNRPALPVLALTTNSSTLTAVSNDFGFDDVFARQVEAHVRRGDLLLLISTSGKSPNVLRAADAARAKGARVIGFTGDTGGPLAARVHRCLRVPSTVTSNIQECHILAGHIVCEIVETERFGGSARPKRRAARRVVAPGRPGASTTTNDEARREAGPDQPARSRLKPR